MSVKVPKCVVKIKNLDVYLVWLLLFCRCGDWQRRSAGTWSNKHPMDPRLSHQKKVIVTTWWKMLVTMLSLSLTDCTPIILSDLRRGSTSRCLRSTPAPSCSSSIWARPPTVSTKPTLSLWARRRMDTQELISVSLSEMLSCSLFERSSQQPTSNGYVF